MILAVGSDHAGFGLKKHLIKVLENWGYGVKDLGCFSEESVDYPSIAEAVAMAVKRGEARFGLLVCGTGQGMAMAANKIPGIRAAVCQEVFSAGAAREHNDANILAMGARVIGQGTAELILKEFLNTEFAGGRHARRVDLISDIENKYLNK
ncbi:MAG: ribose 5-phosphate isomerase B [Candidatus Saccharibacteria bacterium]